MFSWFRQATGTSTISSVDCIFGTSALLKATCCLPEHIHVWTKADIKKSHVCPPPLSSVSSLSPSLLVSVTVSSLFSLFSSLSTSESLPNVVSQKPCGPQITVRHSSLTTCARPQHEPRHTGHNTAPTRNTAPKRQARSQETPRHHWGQTPATCQQHRTPPRKLTRRNNVGTTRSHETRERAATLNDAPRVRKHFVGPRPTSPRHALTVGVPLPSRHI